MLSSSSYYCLYIPSTYVTPVFSVLLFDSVYCELLLSELFQLFCSFMLCALLLFD